MQSSDGPCVEHFIDKESLLRFKEMGENRPASFVWSPPKTPTIRFLSSFHGGRTEYCPSSGTREYLGYVVSYEDLCASKTLGAHLDPSDAVWVLE